MTLYLDSSGNYLLGNASYNGSFELNSDVNLTNLYNNLINFLIQSKWYLDYIPTEDNVKTLFTTAVANRAFLILGAKSDKSCRIHLSPSQVMGFYDDLGINKQDIKFTSVPTTNRIMTLGNSLSGGNINTNLVGYSANADETSFRFLGVSNGNSLGLIHTQVKSNSSPLPIFKNSYQSHYICVLEDYNAGHLGNNILNRYLLLSSTWNLGTPHSSGFYNLNETTGTNLVCGKIFISGSEIRIAQNINTYYPYQNNGNIQWATDFIVYNEAGNLLGKAPNLKIANGIYTFCKPIKLLNYNEAGNNSWIPFGILGGKTVLMRCYSSSLNSLNIQNISLENTDNLLNPEYCPLDMSSYYTF